MVIVPHFELIQTLVTYGGLFFVCLCVAGVASMFYEKREK